MKTLPLTITFILLSLYSLAQSLPDFDAIKLEKKEDYNAAAENAVMTASNYLFSTPLDKNDINRQNCMLYILRWMEGTPDYSFTFDEQATKFAKKNSDLLGLYMAGMTKFVLENKSDSKGQNKIRLNALKFVINYAREEKNKVKMNGEFKKAMEAESKGKLEEYLGM